MKRVGRRDGAGQLYTSHASTFSYKMSRYLRDMFYLMKVYFLSAHAGKLILWSKKLNQLCTS